MTAAILAIFVLSGAAGLIYEVVWARELVLVFGNTTQAVSAILTGFFGGMAIGSALGGRLADRVRRRLRMYGVLELALVVVVLVTPLTFALIKEAYRGVFPLLEAEPTVLALVRFALALLALGPATILMGATLPTLTRYLTTDRELSRAFGRLYAANTIGAIVGTVVAGFVLIELFGLSGSILVGATCSGVAGLSAVVLDRTRAREDRAVETAPPTTAEDAPPGGVERRAAAPARLETARSRLRLALAIAFASGLTSLGYQTLWTRLLASGTGNSTYVFSAILAIFLVGLALGAVAFNVLRDRGTRVMPMLALSQLGVAAFSLVGMVVIGQVTVGRGVAGFVNVASDPGQFLPVIVIPVAVVVLPPTFFMGISFPAASGLLEGTHAVGTRSGLLLAVNTTGAIVGTFVVPFFVIPLVGSPAAVALFVLINAVIAAILALHPSVAPSQRLVDIGGSALIVVLVAVSLVRGLVFVDPSVSRLERGGAQLDLSLEDEIASVQAGSVDGFKQLWVTGTSMTVMSVDTKLMPILPLMVRPESTRALVVAFGMGTAYRSALIAGLRTEAVELVPSVPAVFGDFYSDAGAVLTNPAGRVLIADGRNHVELTNERYDIVVVDPPPPIESSGVSVISSLEFYRAAHDRLTPGGVMMQWVPFGQTLDEFKAHVRTFATVYPNVIVAAGPGRNGFYMLGSDEPMAFDESSMRSVLERPNVLADISSAFDSGRHSEAEWLAFIPSLVRLSGDQVPRFAGSGPLITDDRPLPEYFLLRHAFGAKSPQLVGDLVRAP